MNGDRLILDRKGPRGSVRARVLVADSPHHDASWDKFLSAPMPPARPRTLTEELCIRRHNAHTDTVVQHVMQFLQGQYGQDMSVDEPRLHLAIERYIRDTGAAPGNIETVHWDVLNR